MAERIKLHGERAEKFNELRAQLTQELGYEPSKPEAFGLIMAEFPEQEYPPPVE